MVEPEANTPLPQPEERPRAYAFGVVGIGDSDFSAEGPIRGELDVALTQKLKDKLWHCLDLVNGSDIFDRGGSAVVKFRKDAQLISMFREETEVQVFVPEIGEWVTERGNEPLELGEVEAHMTRESAQRFAFEVRGVTPNGYAVRYNFDPYQHDFMTTVEKFHAELEMPEGQVNAQPNPRIRAKPSVIKDAITNQPVLVVDVG